MPYRGRIAPTPTGHLHLGHARTFWIAQQRCLDQQGVLVFRNEDLDQDRCRAEFVSAMFTDLRWFGLDWQEGPDVGGPYGPYTQGERLAWYVDVWKMLQQAGVIYPSPHSRRDVQTAHSAPHAEDQEPIFPIQLRPLIGTGIDLPDSGSMNWRFRVPDGQTIAFVDARAGLVERTAGVDFGDFLVWRKDGFPAYELAVVADDHAMEITEVVRGDDLLTSTARQLLIYSALNWTAPQFHHCPLMCDEQGKRLAKRALSQSLRSFRVQGIHPEDLRSRQQWLMNN